MQRIRKGDLVVVIAGEDRGTRGRVLRVDRERDRVVVEGVRRVKRHVKARPNQPGGIVEVEAPIHISNVMPVDPKTDRPTRVRAGTDKDGRKVRIAARSGALLDG
ncbi:MAG: 50S ribosomal protein L24 [Myxococcota bacterium]|nr:50S ribosomal protein L24 [Myxococcota bacterium]MDW8363238.1 50S ribosomal protein L24 [Myxococcales bacterium]